MSEPLTYKSGNYFVYTSGCCQKPPVCSLPPDYIGLHAPPRWEILYISDNLGVRFCGCWIPLNEFVGVIGDRIELPEERPDSSGWDHARHYTFGG
jgi:hypothetical protein